MSQPPLWIVGSLRWCGQLAEAERTHAAIRVALDLGGRELDVPQRHDAERDVHAARRRAPLLDHPVVVRLHAREAEITVGRLVERLAAEPRERRERQRTVGPVELEVLDARVALVATGPHLVVGDRGHHHLATGRTSRRHRRASRRAGSRRSASARR